WRIIEFGQGGPISIGVTLLAFTVPLQRPGNPCIMMRAETRVSDADTGEGRGSRRGNFIFRLLYTAIWLRYPLNEGLHFITPVEWCSIDQLPSDHKGQMRRIKLSSERTYRSHGSRPQQSFWQSSLKDSRHRFYPHLLNLKETEIKRDHYFFCAGFEWRDKAGLCFPSKLLHP
ncbi:hypothetical protein AOLI_G00310270, partial [Acnodon oligacanthus]